MSRGSGLIRRQARSRSPHLFPAFPAPAQGYAPSRHHRLRPDRQLGRGRAFLAYPIQKSSTSRAAFWNFRFHYLGGWLQRRGSTQIWPLSGFAPRPLGIGFGLPLGKRRGLSALPTLQLLDLGPQLSYQPLLLEDQGNQLFAASLV